MANSVKSPLLNAEEALENAAVAVYESVLTDTDQDGEDEEIVWLRHERLSNKSLHWLRRPSLTMISFSCFLLVVAVMFALPSKMELILKILCESQNPSSGICDRAQAQMEMSRMEGVSFALNGALQILVLGKLGQFSDIYGRKRVFLVNSSAMALTICCQVYIIWLGLKNNHFYKVAYVMVSSIHPLAGGLAGIFPVAYAYVIDVVEEEERIFSMGVISAAISCGASIGPALASPFLKYVFTSPFQALLVSICMMMVGISFVIFILPESRSQRLRHKSRQKSISERERRELRNINNNNNNYNGTDDILHYLKSSIEPLKSLWLPASIDPITNKKNYRPRITMIILLIMNSCWVLVTQAPMPTLILYFMFRFDATAVSLGYYITSTAGFEVFVLMVLAPIFLHRIKSLFKINIKQLDRVDLSTMQFAVSLVMIGLCVAISSQKWYQFLLAGCIQAFGSLFTPALKSSMAKYASLSNSGTGMLLGAASSVESVMHCLGPILYATVYSNTVKSSMPQTFLYVMLSLALVNFVCLLILVYIQPPQEEGIELPESDHDQDTTI